MAHESDAPGKSTEQTSEELECRIGKSKSPSISPASAAATFISRRSWKIEIPQKSDDERTWLPGQPPPRLSPHHHERLLRTAKIPVNPLAPISKIRLQHDLGNPCLQKYLGQSISSPECSPDEIYLFHGTALGPSSAHVINSFLELGPSLHFARPQGYLSPSPAVYYTTSIEFALTWIVFTSGGKWDLDGGFASPGLSGLIYVSKANIKRLLETTSGIAFPNPETEDDERVLQNWCVENEYGKPASSEITRRLTGHDIWRHFPLLFSRVPWSTLTSLQSEGQCPSMLRSHIDPFAIWLLAASNNEAAEYIAKLGQEIIVVRNKKVQSGL